MGTIYYNMKNIQADTGMRSSISKDDTTDNKNIDK